MPNLFTRAVASLRTADRRRRDAIHLASLPDHLLRDMGLTPDGEASLRRQIAARQPR
jgi:uncharacterized protein YjiS (DUF1127 family)